MILKMINKIKTKHFQKQQNTTIHFFLKILFRTPVTKEKPAEGQQRWGQPNFLWEGVPEIRGSSREGSLPCPDQVHL